MLSWYSDLIEWSDWVETLSCREKHRESAVADDDMLLLENFDKSNKSFDGSRQLSIISWTNWIVFLVYIQSVVS